MSGSFPSEFRAGLRHAFLVPVLVLRGAFIRTFTLVDWNVLFSSNIIENPRIFEGRLVSINSSGLTSEASLKEGFN